MPRTVTLKDVAREAGVDVSTASRALNAETRSVVNAATAARVRAVAERLGYQPHPLARGLRTSRTQMVGMVVPDLTNPLFPPIYAGAEASLGEHGYSLLIASDDDDPSKAAGVLTALMGRRVDGLILATAHLDFAMPDVAREGDVPTVLVNRSADSTAWPTISGDDHAGIGLAVRHLRALGHTAIAHVAGPRDLSTGLTRRQAFVAWMNSEGLDARSELIVEADAFRTPAGRAACDRLLDSGIGFTAIVAANDLIALGCYDSLIARGLSVPDDVSVTGYNDMAFVDRVAPPLTTIAVPFRQMGSVAAEALLRLMARNGVGDGRAARGDGQATGSDGLAAGSGAHLRGDAPAVTSTRLPPTLVVRGSSGRAPATAVTGPTRSA